LAGDTPAAGDGPWAAPVSAASVVEYMDTDALGSVRAVTDGGGQARRHDFLPFGEEYQAPSGAPDRMLFTEQRRDAESALDYFAARYYRADLGRYAFRADTQASHTGRYVSECGWWDPETPPPHVVFEDLLIPFIRKALASSDSPTLHRVFDFIELLSSSGDPALHGRLESIADNQPATDLRLEQLVGTA
jgi:RHS repeat-associated protein